MLSFSLFTNSESLGWHALQEIGEELFQALGCVLSQDGFVLGFRPMSRVSHQFPHSSFSDVQVDANMEMAITITDRQGKHGGNVMIFAGFDAEECLSNLSRIRHSTCNLTLNLGHDPQQAHCGCVYGRIIVEQRMQKGGE